MGFIDDTLEFLGLRDDGKLKPGEIPDASPFPGAVGNPLDDGTTAASQKLQSALDAARAPASVDAALKTLPIVIVSLDPGGPPYPFAATRATEEDFSASLLKMAALYSAFQLRATANGVSRPLTNFDVSAVLNVLAAALDSKIDSAVPLITQAKPVSGAMRVPHYDAIFVATPAVAGGFDVNFTQFYQTALSDMIAHGKNAATAYCVHGLGYSYINGLMQAAGLFRNAATQNGIWLAADYLDAKFDPATRRTIGTYNGKVMDKWPTVRIDSVNDKLVGQATTCLDMAKLIVLLHDKKLVTDPPGFDSHQEMLDLMAAAVNNNQFWLTHKPPKFDPGDLISGLSYTVTHSKIGVAPLKSGASVLSEGLIIKHTQSGREFAIVWQDMRDGQLVTGLSQIIDGTIGNFLAP
jgi:hypothetical protein